MIRGAALVYTRFIEKSPRAENDTHRPTTKPYPSHQTYLWPQEHLNIAIVLPTTLAQKYHKRINIPEYFIFFGWWFCIKTKAPNKYFFCQRTKLINKNQIWRYSPCLQSIDHFFLSKIQNKQWGIKPHLLVLQFPLLCGKCTLLGHRSTCPIYCYHLKWKSDAT